MARTATGQLRESAISAGVAILVLAGLSWALSRYLQVPSLLDLQLSTWVLLFVVLAGLSLITDRSRKIDLGWVMILIPIILFVLSFAPGFIVDVFSAVINPAFQELELQTTLRGLSDVSVGLFILAVSGAFLWKFLTKRLKGDAKDPAVLVDRTLKDLNDYWESYLSIGRLFVFALLVSAGVIVSQVGNLAGEATEILSQFPAVVAWGMTTITGYAAAGGTALGIDSIPILNQIGPDGFLLIAGVAILIYWAMVEDPSGSLAQFTRRRF